MAALTFIQWRGNDLTIWQEIDSDVQIPPVVGWPIRIEFKRYPIIYSGQLSPFDKVPIESRKRISVGKADVRSIFQAASKINGDEECRLEVKVDRDGLRKPATVALIGKPRQCRSVDNCTAIDIGATYTVPRSDLSDGQMLTSGTVSGLPNGTGVPMEESGLTVRGGFSAESAIAVLDAISKPTFQFDFVLNFGTALISYDLQAKDLEPDLQAFSECMSK